MTKKINKLIIVATFTLAVVGFSQLRAECPSVCKKVLSKSSQKALYGLAKNFLSSKTDTPDSNLDISSSEAIVRGVEPLSLISFIGEDFSDRSSRIDRCYVATFKPDRKSISIVNRTFKSNSSEDSTPCTATEIYSIKQINNSSAWITFISNYRDPQLDQGSEEKILEIYHLNLNTGIVCYASKVTQDVNLTLEKPDKVKLDLLLASRQFGSSSQCSK